MIYTITATTGQWEDRIDVQVLATTKLEIAQAKFDNLKESLESLYWDMAISEHNRCVNNGAEFYNVSELVWNIGYRGWFEDTIDLSIMGMGEDELTSEIYPVNHVSITVAKRFTNKETEVNHLFDLQPLTKYEILALPYGNLDYLNYKSAH
jgi:hypothetical protein